MRLPPCNSGHRCADGGFPAQYETAGYDEALYIFARMQEKAERKMQLGYQALALIWQGHMLDLLGRRPQAC